MEEIAISDILYDAAKKGGGLYYENAGVVWSVTIGTDSRKAVLTKQPRIVLMRNTSYDLNVLTKRETEIIKLIIDGNTYRYISRTLRICEGTVKKTVHNAYKKLGISSRVELMSPTVTELKAD